MMEKKTWKEFKEAKLLWWVNRLLCLFGWCIVFDMDSNDNILDVYPAQRDISKLSPYIGKNAGEVFIDDLEEIEKNED